MFLKPIWEVIMIQKKIFLMQGENRNGLLLKNLKKLVLFELKERRKPGGDKDDYNEVMKWLEEIASGKMKADCRIKWRIKTEMDSLMNLCLL